MPADISAMHEGGRASQIKTVPSEEPAATWRSSGPRQAVHQTVPTLKPGARSERCTCAPRSPHAHGMATEVCLLRSMGRVMVVAASQQRCHSHYTKQPPCAC